MEKRSVTMVIGGQPCRFVSDDSEEYLSALEQRANETLRRTEACSGASGWSHAMLSVLSLTDELLRAEERIQALSAPRKPEGSRELPARKAPGRDGDGERGQISVWDLLDQD